MTTVDLAWMLPRLTRTCGIPGTSANKTYLLALKLVFVPTVYQPNMIIHNVLKVAYT